jgi:mannose-6-phosphate isomerase-like protein (cupin superfamily)
MGYQVIDVGDIEPSPDRPSETIEISDHFVDPYEGDGEVGDREPSRGPRKFGLRVYTARPGEQIPLQYHRHEEQEEAFFVLEGTLHVETPEGEYVVAEEQAFVVDPGSPHRAFNPEDADDRVRILAVGAPSYTVMGRNDASIYDPDEE